MGGLGIGDLHNRLCGELGWQRLGGDLGGQGADAARLGKVQGRGPPGRLRNSAGSSWGHFMGRDLKIECGDSGMKTDVAALAKELGAKGARGVKEIDDLG